jgi:predicted nucleic acid-binding Zn ribbon protein
MAVERASASLDKTLTRVLRRVPLNQSILLAWPVACGGAVADRTRAVSFEKGVLSVEVPDQRWRRELTALAGQYLAALNRFSSERVQRIEFLVHR